MFKKSKLTLSISRCSHLTKQCTKSNFNETSKSAVKVELQIIDKENIKIGKDTITPFDIKRTKVPRMSANKIGKTY